MIGQRLMNRYEFTKLLGRGGMGVVYLAHDPVLDRDVAVKLISPGVLSDEIEARFTREARVVAKMDHASIVGVYDFGSHDGSLFFVMPFVQGTNLRAFLRAETMRLVDAIDLGIQAASALDYSHAMGVIHRDIKPENMMVSRHDDELRVRITDFGLAFTAKENRITRTNALMGSVSYFSPEQVKGRTVDPRSDIYSLGIVLYECLVGAPPFVGDIHAVLYRIVNELITPARTAQPNVPAELDAVVMQCLAREPSARPARAKEIADALTRLRAKLDASERALVVADTVVTLDSGSSARPAEPLIGRDKEHAELQKRLLAAMAGEGQLVVVTGEAGIGKSRLLDALDGLAGVKGVPVLRASFAEQHQAFPYQAYYDLIVSFVRGRGTASQVSLPDLADLAPDLLALFPALADVEPFRDVAQAPAPPRGDTTYYYDVLARTLIRLGRGRPLVLMLDDLHAATASLDALQYIVHRLAATPTLVVGAYTDSEIDKGHPLARFLDGMKGSRRFASVALARFSPSEHRLFVEHVVGSSRLDPALVDKLREVAEGNPYVTRELLRSLMDAGSVSVGASGEWSLALEREISAEDLPATLHDAVEKRLERLDDEPKRILGLASVLGRSFDVRDLEAIAGEVDLDRGLDRLLIGGFLQEERASRGDRLAFTSGVVCDAVYKALPRRKKRSAHLEAAQAIEARAKGRLERVYGQLLHHYVRADETDKVRDLGLKQARHALASLSIDEAIAAARSVLEFLDDDDSLAAETHTLLATAYRLKGNFDAALKEAEAAVEASRGAAAMVLAAEIAWDARRMLDVRRWIDRGLASGADVASQRKLLVLATTMANLRGEFDLARSHQAQLAALPSDAASPEEVAPSGGTVAVGFQVEARARAPSEIGRDVEVEVLANAFETLIATDEHGQLTPRLCTRWEAHGAAFVFHLRRDVKFHDGSPLTAADVKASLEAAAHDGEVPTVRLSRTSSGAIDAGPRVEVVDDHTVRVELGDALPIYPALLTASQKAIAKGGLGTGPFKLESIERGRYRLARNADYHGTPPRVDALDMRTGLSAATIASELRDGTLDIGGDLGAAELEPLLRDRRAGLSRVEATKNNICYVLFNTRRGPCSSPVLRQVLCERVHPHEVVWQALGRFAQPAVGLIPPGILGHDAGRRRPTLAVDQAVAKLGSANVATPMLLRAAVHPLLLDRYKPAADALVAAWSELGINVLIGTHDMTSFIEAFGQPERFDLLISRYIADYDDPDAFTYGFFHGRAGDQRAYFNTAELDRMLEEARAIAVPATRDKLYKRIETYVLGEHAVLPLFHEVDYRLLRSCIRNASLRSAPPYVSYTSLAKVEVVDRAATVRGGGLITVPIHQPLASLDYTESNFTWQDDITLLVWETLTTVGPHLEIVPHLASEFAAEAGGRRYRFRLRDDVRFHDGRRLTARDVRASWEHLLRGAGSFATLLLSITGARAVAARTSDVLAGFEIVSPLEFVIALDEPLANFPAMLAGAGAAVHPEEGYRTGTSWRDGAIGTGPFRIARFEPRRTLELEANPAYWRAGVPKAESLVFHIDVPREQLSAELVEGRASAIRDVRPGELERLRAQPQYARGYHANPTLSTTAVLLNVHAGPLVDEGLRHEVVAAIAGAARKHVGPLASAARTYTPPGFLAQEPRTFKSRTMPAPRSEPVELSLLFTATQQQSFGTLLPDLHDALASRGFRVKDLVSESFGPLIAQGKGDLHLGRWTADYPDIDGMLYRALHTREGFYGGYVGTPEVDRLLEAARRELDPSARHKLYRDVETLLADRAILAPLLHVHNYAFVQPGVRGGDQLVTMLGYAYDQLWNDS